MSFKIKHRLAINLRILRENKGVTQKRVCQEIEAATGVYISNKTYGFYERDMSEPHINLLKAMANFYEITIDDLCFNHFKPCNNLLQKI